MLTSIGGPRLHVCRQRSLAYGACIVLSALALLDGLALAGLTAERSVGRGPGIGRMGVQSTDSVLVFGPNNYVNYGGPEEWTVYEVPLNLTVARGRRYIVEVRQGEARVSALTFSVNGQQWIGSSEFGIGTSRILRRIEVESDNTLRLELNGVSESSVDVRIVHVKEPNFVVFGPKTYVRPDSIQAQVDTFSIPAAAKSPHTLYVINGSPDGSNRVTNGTVTLNGVQVLGPSDFGAGKATMTRQVTLQSSNTVSVLNQSAAGTQLSLRFWATDSTPPVLAVTSPPEGLITEGSTVVVSGSVTDECDGTVSVNGRPWFPTPGAFADTIPLPADGHYTFTVHAENGAGFSVDSVRHVTRDTQPPTLNVTAPGNYATLADSIITAACMWDDMTQTLVTVDGDTVGDAAIDSVGFNFTLDMGLNRLLFRAVDALGHPAELPWFVFRQSASEPDTTDSLVAGSEPTAAGIRSFLEQVRFLYADSPPLQTGVTESSLQPAEAAVVRGKVIGRDWTALPNVTVSILGHPEFGETATRADGWYDLVVNGGVPLTLRFQKPGFLEGQRRVETYPNDYVIVDDVAMVGKSALARWVDLSAGQVVRSRFASDANGDRDMRLFFRPQTVARVVGAGTDTVDFSNVHVRATEYTIGADGPRAMPAQLPPSSAYTYCVDLSLVEADSVAAATGQSSAKVRFTKPVTCYVRNFLHFPVGMSIPFGFYDSEAGAWKPDSDGVVLKILSISGDTVRVDSDGDTLSDSAERLDSLKIDPLELQQLRGQFVAGDTIWRAVTYHFSSSDLNPNQGPAPTPLKVGNGLPLRLGGLVPDPICVTGSIIECENCVLGQSIPIVGTPYALNYRSFRAPGDASSRTLRVPVVGDTVPNGLKRILARMDVAGKRQETELASPAPNDSVVFVWDGKDAYGRLVDESATARVSIGYEYNPPYVGGSGGRSLGNPGASGGVFVARTGDRDIGRMSWARRTVRLGVPQPLTDGLGGWTISPHHFYDMKGRGAMYLGDGSVVLGETRPPIVTTFAGNLSSNILPTACSPKLTVKLNPNDVAVGPDGSVFIADQLTHSIYRILPGAGTLCRVAGTGSAGAYVDGDSATKTQLRNPQRLALGPDGSIYFVMKYMGGNCTRACRVTPDGIIHSIAGTGEWSVSSSGDGGPATQAKLVEPSSIALGIDGSVFIGDGGGHRVRRVDPDGIITTYAGTGGAGYSDSTGPAIAIRIGTSEGLAVDGDGSLYIAEASGQQIRRVTPDGVMSIFLKGAPTDFWPWDIDFGPDGALYIVSGAGQHRIYKRDPDGNLLSIAGTSGTGSTLDGSYAARTAFYELRGIGVGSDGTAFFTNNAKVIGRLAPALASKVGSEFVVPSADGSEVFYFDEAGKHVRTRDALTGAVRYVFNYDAEGRLISLYDVNGDSTVIARGENGQAERIVAPYGQETALGIDAHGYLHTVTNPASQTITVSARPDGLLESLEDAKHQVHEFEYHPDGRLWVDSDPAGGSQTLTKDTGLNRHFVTRETALHRSTSYELVEFSDGARQRLIKGPDQLTVVLSDSTDGNRRGVLPTGVVVTHSLVKDQRFGVLAPLLASEWIAMPSGLTRTVQVSRTTDPSGFDPPFVNGTWTEERSVNGRASLVSTFNSAVSPPLLSVTTPEERVATATVDSAGRPLTVSVPGQADVTLTYDARGRLERSEQRGRGLRFGYDARGRLSEVRDTLGRMTSFTYDSANRVIQQDLPGGRQVVYGYDDNGNLTSLTPPGRPTHRFDYTPIDLMAKYYSPGAGEADSMTEYVYNADRQLERILRPGDDDVLVNYNTTTGRVESIETGRGEVGVTYLTTGQVHTVTSPDGVTLTYAYDGPLDTLEAWSGGVTGSVSAAFDRDFRVSSQRVNGGDAVVYDYDNDGLMTQAGALAIDRERNDGLISGTTLQNVTTTESYWHVGELWRTTATIGGYTLYQATYERDSLGRITEITETVLDDPATTKTYTYGSPDTGFIATVATDGTVSERYSYDGNGNRLRFTTPGGTTTAEYDDQDRITRYGTMYYTYAPAGELATASTGGNLTRYTYDALGNLVKVRFQNGDSLEYVIDGRSRRVARKFNGTVTRKWLYQDQLEPVAELDGAGTLVARYVYGTRPHVPDYMVRNDTTYRIISDHLGSVRLVVNASTGDVAQYIGYDTYGRLKFDTNPGFQCFGYAGGLWDSTTGLVRFGARDYDPSVGRWTAKDPIGFAGLQTNLYAYVQNQPSQLIDPFGLDASQRGGASSADNYMVAGEQMLGHLAEAYGFAEGTRRALAQRFPGTGGASVLRHELASELIAYYYGGSAVRILGVGNEVQGLLLYDVPDLLGRLRGLRPWAFEVLDLVHNEIGIKRAERARLRLETRGHDSPCQGRSD